MKESKILIIAFLVIGIICCCMVIAAYFGLNEFGNRVENMVQGDPTAVAQMQQKIANFDTPPGYRNTAMSMFIYDMVMLIPTNSNKPMIMLMQYNGAMSGNRQQIEESLRQAAQQQSPQQGVSLQVVDSFETTIRNETVIVTVSEGSNQSIVLRQWIAIFEGNNGPVIFMAQGTSAEWDERLLIDFMNSIR